MKLWMYLHFPHLQLNSMYLDQSLKAGPLVIVEGRRNVIVQLSEPAKSEGIKAGMGLATAASLCSELQVFPYEADCEFGKLKEIAHWLYLLTSDICLFPPNGILLQVSNMLTLYDGLERYWQALSQHLSALGFDYSYASAYSPYAARILARRSSNLVSADKVLINKRLYSCALLETDLSTKQVEKLSRVGIKHLEDLLAIPLSELAKRFDADLVNYIGRLSGHFHHAVSFYHPPETFDRSLDLLFEIENTQWLEKPLLKLLEPLAQFLRIRDQFAHELRLVLYLRNEEFIQVVASSAAGEYRAQSWLALFNLRFESVTLDSPIKRIQLIASRVQARSGEMADLFDGRLGNTSALELVSILQAKLGSDAVSGVSLTEDPRPHLSSQYGRPFSDVNNHNHTLPERDSSLLRPSILLPNPEPLRQKISIMQGPERLATGWWDAQPLIRDYFIARASNGSWLWVFRTPEQQWFLHGVFS